MATLTISLYATTMLDVNSGWKNSAQYFWPVMYNHDFAGRIGMSGIDGVFADGEEYSDILRTMIAYSAIDEGTRVFGDAAIVSFYSDANSFGEALLTSDASS